MDHLSQIFGGSSSGKAQESKRIDAFLDRFPVLGSFFFQEDFEGKSRHTGRVTLFSRGGGLKARFAEPSMKLIGWYDVQGNGPLCAELETALSSGLVEWVEDRNANGLV